MPRKKRQALVRAIKRMTEGYYPPTKKELPDRFRDGIFAVIHDDTKKVTELAESRANMAKADGYEVQCRKGCAACCFDYAMLSGPEFVLLAEGYDSLSDEDKAHVATQNAAWMDAHKDLDEKYVYVFDTEEQGRTAEVQGVNEEMIGETTRRSWIKGTPCSFLKESKCLVYDYRPMACRGHNLIDPRGPRLCSEVLHSEEEKKALRFDMSDAAIAVLQNWKRQLPVYPLGELNVLLSRHLRRLAEGI